MSHLNMDVGNTSKKWLLGIKADGSQVSREEAAIIFWAWRCLYAEVVGARKENRCMKPSKAYANLVRMAYTRESQGLRCQVVPMVLEATQENRR